MTTLAEFMIVAGVENRPPMLDKEMYNSWESRMLLYIKGKKNDRMMLESIKNGHLVYPTIEEDGQLRKKKNQTTIQDGRVTVQQVQGRHGQGYFGIKGSATGLGVNQNGGNTTIGQARVVKCYNYQGEGHMARKCTQPKRPRNTTWFKEKLMLVEAQVFGQVLDEEQLAFLADPRITECHDV
nr:retrovirus-related Pol polyprotein from transposon TNT 1-94 [Tanacetum cinerariifolium]